MAQADDAAKMYTATATQAADLGLVYEEKKEIIGQMDGGLSAQTKTSPEYRKFDKIRLSREAEDEPLIFSARRQRLAAGAAAQDLVVANRRAKGAASSGERAAWEAADLLAHEEVAALQTGVAKEDQELGLLDAARAAEIGENEDLSENHRRGYDAVHLETVRLAAAYAGIKVKMVTMEEEATPEARTSPHFEKFEKIKAELEEDEPYVVRKREAKIAAYSGAQEMVTASRRLAPTPASSLAKSEAWRGAEECAVAEKDALEGIITKGDGAADSLTRAANDGVRAACELDDENLREAKRRAALAESALFGVDLVIDEERENLESLKRENLSQAACIEQKGPEFKDDVVAHKKSLLSIQRAEIEAVEHRDEKTAAANAGHRAKKGVRRGEEEMADLAKKVEAERGAFEEVCRLTQVRRRTLVTTVGAANKEVEAYRQAEKAAEAELRALREARECALKVKILLAEADEAKVLRSGMGLLLLDGMGIVDVGERRRNFDKRDKLAQHRPVEQQRMKAALSDDDQIRVPSGATATEHDDPSLGDGSKNVEMLFETSGDWTSALASEVKRLAPYAAPTGEYMPLEGAGSRALPTAAQRVRVSKRPHRAQNLLRDPKNPAAVNMKGVQLFRAAVRLVMATLVISVKPLTFSDMAGVARQIELARQHQGRQEEALAALPALLRDPSQPTPRPARHLNTEHKERALAISRTVVGFMSRLKTHKSTERSEASYGKSSKSIVVGVQGQGDAQAHSEIRHSEIHKHNEKAHHSSHHSSILSLIHGPGSTDMAVLEDEEVVETSKESRLEQARSVQSRAEHSVEQSNIEETEAVETLEITGRE